MADFQNTNGGNATYFKPNTDGLTMFNDEDMMLRVSYYDEFMKLELRAKNAEGKFPAPELGKDIGIMINREKVTVLSIMLDEFDKKLIEYNNDFADGKDCSEYKPYSIAVHVGQTPEKTRVLQISTGTVTEKGFVPVVYIHIGTTPDLIANATYKFQTRTSPVIVNYDATTGDVDMKHKLGQYEILNATIRNFVVTSSKSHSHFAKTVVNDEKLNKMENVVKLIADAMNIQIPDTTYGGYNGGRYRSSSPFDSFGNPTSDLNNTHVVVENGGDLGTLLGQPTYR